MGTKYRGYNPGSRNTREKQGVHPIWRGVGFGLMVLIPIISYAAAVILMEQNEIYGWYPFPVDLLAKSSDWMYQIIPDPLIYIRLLLTFGIMVALYAVFTMVSFIVMGMFGVSKKDDPYYVPPVTRSERRISRGHRR